ncbi:MAG: hypothetical protein JSS24_13905 [Proteobacteria bacterium]|nr:hypothetical protein [Pseudomonadota bacterium]
MNKSANALHGHQLVGAPLHRRFAARGGEAVALADGPGARLLDHHLTLSVHIEIHAIAGR